MLPIGKCKALCPEKLPRDQKTKQWARGVIIFLVEDVSNQKGPKGIVFWKRFSMISKKATFNGKQPSCFHISTHPIPVFLGMYNSFMPIWELQWQLRKTWRSEWCLTFYYEGKKCACSSLPTTPSNAGWSLKIVLLSIMLFQLEMIWNCSLMVQVGWEPTSIVWGFGWRLWEYESDTMARYNCEMNALKVKT